MVQNKAEIASESIYNPRASRALERALDPSHKGLRACDVLQKQFWPSGFLLIFLTAGNLIAIGGYNMPGVWGQRPQRGPGAAPRRGPRGSAPGGVKGQSPLRGPGAAPLEAIRFSQSDKVKSTQPVMHK